MQPLQKIILLMLLFVSGVISAQDTTVNQPVPARKLNYFSLAFTNNHSAFPFSSFSQLVAGEWHPGFEIGSGFNWKVKKKHDWYQDFRVGYFYHQFVQHGIPLYTSFGYRYKFSERWNAQSGLGAGFLFSIPDHQRFKLNGTGDYEKINSLGRAQGMFVFNISTGYKLGMGNKHPVELFLAYQQRIQTPYVPSYVPLLPYNSLILGIKRFR